VACEKAAALPCAPLEPLTPWVVVPALTCPALPWLPPFEEGVESCTTANGNVSPSNAGNAWAVSVIDGGTWL
jgi:hypothetical protein